MKEQELIEPETTESALTIPVYAQVVIDIAKAVRDSIDNSNLYHDDFDLIFKAAVQMAFATQANW